MRGPRRLAFALLSTGVAIVLVVACGLDVRGTEEPLVDVIDEQRVEASLPSREDVVADDASIDVRNDVAACPTGLRGPSMVPSPDASFCIDSTEVSAGDYSEFVAAVAADAAVDFSQRPWCRADAGFAPSQGPLSPSGPVRCVSYCDAYAYCQWAGKHLCTGEPTTGEWPRACTNEFERSLPYGQDGGGSCNFGQSADPSGPTEAGSYKSCMGGFDGLFDMVGNVAELVDDCTDDGGTCSVLGGAWYSSYLTTCATREEQAPGTKTACGVGFRCCR
jgi:formylglycine-generating enzyme required for sulfatase activity